MTTAAPVSGSRAVKMPPFLLLAALAFWGWQSGFLLVGVLLGAALESARLTQARWNLDDSEFNRIWSVCVVLTVALAGYTFTTGAGGWRALLHGHPDPGAVPVAVPNGARFLCWLPMTTFVLIVAQIFNARPTVPLTAVSLVLRWRRRKGDPTFRGHYLDIGFPYFAVCLFSAGMHTNAGSQLFFWCQGALIAWALWLLRSRRFGVVTWLAALAVVIALGFLGEFGINQAGRALQALSAQWITRLFNSGTDPLQSITSMGRIGELKLSAQIVIWLTTEKHGPAPTYLREASYRTYRAQNQTWYAGEPRISFENVTPERDGATWVLVPGKTNKAAVNLACYLGGWTRDGVPEGVLPLPSGCGRLADLPAASVVTLQKNPAGAVLATGAGLMIFDADYGPGATMDAPPDTSTNHLDLAVPPGEVPALKQVIAELDLTNADEAEKLRAVRKFFLDHFTYSVWQGADKAATANASPLTRFLLTSRSGHCEYFATATVLLLREWGIPARYAVGYFVHEAHGASYVVRERDAHAWCLVWNRATKTWEDFDTTPPSWVAIESRRTADVQWLADVSSWLRFEFEKYRWQQTHLRQYIFGVLAPVLILLLYYIIFRRRRQQTVRAPGAARWKDIFRPGLDSEFYLLERKLTARGIPRQPGEPLSDWLKRPLAEPALAGLQTPFQELLRLHYRHRFDPRGLSDQERETLAREAKICLDRLSQIQRRPARPA
jgi:protein-glutamine gamma-glutamyltransferase